MRSRNSFGRFLLLWCLLVPSLIVDFGFDIREVQAQPINQNKQLADRDYETARLQLYKGSLLTAKTKFENALRIYQAANDQVGEYNSLIGLAKVDYKQAKYQSAKSKLIQISRYGIRDGQATTLEGLIALELGDYNQALSRLRVGVHQLQINQSRDRLSRQELNEARIALGEVYSYQGLYKQAENNLYQALNIAHNPHARRRAFNALGSIQLEIGQYDQALKTFEQAFSVPNIPGDRIGKAKTLENLGRAYQVTGDRNQALKQYQLALGELRSIGAWSRQVYVLNNLGLLATDLGLNNRALEYFQLAEGTLSNSGGVGRVITYVNLGYYYSQRKDYDLATDYLERALGWAKSNGDRIGEAKALSGLGAIQLRSQDLRGATKTLAASIKVFESLRPGLRDEQKISLFETQKQTYDLLQQAYVAQDKSPEALTIAERGRARAFIELLAQRMSTESEIDLDITPPSLKEIKTVAQNRQATIVNYSIIEDQNGIESQLYIWVVNPQGEINLRQLDLATIQKQFKTSIASVSSDSREAVAGGLDLRKPRLQDYVISFRGDVRANSAPERRKLSFARDAYKLLIEPIKDLLPQDPEQLVVLIPQGSLFLVPFPALQSSEGEYLIEQHTLQIAPSIQTLAIRQPEQSTITNAKSQALIVGNPKPMPESLSQLTGAETEAKAIADILQTTPIIGQAATETNVIDKMKGAKLIHLATHGLFDEHQGLQSSLAFSTSDHSDGFLTAEEILNLNLAAELVVLSACNTGRGRITGDGVVGLSRSFLLAGAKNTMVSLWYVPDFPTSALMTNFYRQLQENQHKPQALRQAMLSTMEEYPSPRDWAAFILVGQ